MEITFVNNMSLQGRKKNPNQQHYVKDGKGFFVHIENNIKRNNSKETGVAKRVSNIDKTWTQVLKNTPQTIQLFSVCFHMGKVPSE